MDYNTLERDLRNAGYRVVVLPSNNVCNSLVVSCGVDCSVKQSLRIHSRKSEWFVSLPGPRHFHVTRSSRLHELCCHLLKSAIGPRKTIHIEPDSIDAFALVEISDVKWSDMERVFEMAHWSQQGWRELDEHEKESVWDRFNVVFGFPAGRLIEPCHSATWDISSVIENDVDEAGRLENDFNVKILQAFVHCTAPVESLYVLDYRHSCFLFSPHNMSDPIGTSWPVSLFPNGDYHFFVASDFRFGLLGDVDGNVCVFGNALLCDVVENRPLVLREPIRSRGNS